MTDTKHRRAHGFLIVVAIGIALLVLWRTLLAIDSSAPEHSAEQQLVKADASLSRAMPVASASPATTPDVAMFVGFPVGVVRDPARRYAFAKDCAKFRHFDAFYREKAADPNWPLSNPEALAAADPERRSKLLETSRFLDQHRQSCNSWLEVTPQDLANAQIYDASLQAAIRGDQNAAACFLLAAWQKPGERSPYHKDVIKAYDTYARRFLQEGLKTGSWPIVLAAYQASQEENSLHTSAIFSAQDAYLLARLAQQGAPDAADESQHGYQATNAARFLTAADLVALDKRASDLFSNQFEKKKVSVQSVADMCVN